MTTDADTPLKFEFELSDTETTLIHMAPVEFARMVGDEAQKAAQAASYIFLRAETALFEAFSGHHGLKTEAEQAGIVTRLQDEISAVIAVECMRAMHRLAEASTKQNDPTHAQPMEVIIAAAKVQQGFAALVRDNPPLPKPTHFPHQGALS